MSQNFIYPPGFSSATLTINAEGANGSPIPSESLQVGGEDPSGDLQPIQLDASGNLLVAIGAGIANPLPTQDAADGSTGAAVPAKAIYAGMDVGGNLVGLQGSASGLKVDVQASVLPTGAATEATLLAISAQLPPALGAQLTVDSVAVNIASDQVVPVSAASLPLPAGAATSANQVIELSRLSGSLVPTAFDEVALTYVTLGNGIGQIDTAVYKLASATVKTLTMSYDGSDRLSGVVAS